MSSSLIEEYQSVRGIADILPNQIDEWLYVEEILLNLISKYGYKQIRLPLVEKTALFKRAIGDATDIVEKEMFTFLDEKSRSLSLRPEGTAGCVRACLESGLLRNLPLKLFYLGPMFRYEAPQKGRSRQFHQLGIECFGVDSCEAEVEQIAIFSRLWKELGLEHCIQLEINTLGEPQLRKIYIKELINYFEKYYEDLDLDSKRRLKINPLRILDSKNPEMFKLLQNAPKLINYLDGKALNDYNLFKLHLSKLNINYLENFNIVRGLDYYTGIVWEWSSNLLGSQSAVGAGGRYNNLIAQLGGNQVAAVGLAIGLERLILLLQQQNKKIPTNNPKGYLICVGEQALQQKFIIAEKIREFCPQFSFVLDLLGGNFKNQFKRADKSEADIALVLGDNEIANNSITIKHLRSSNDNQQITIKLSEINKFI